MTNIYSYNQQLYQLKLEGDYKGAIAYYKDTIHKNTTPEEIKAHPFLVPNLLHCLRKNGQEKEAFVFMEKQLSLEPGTVVKEHWTFEIGWTLYQVLKKNGMAVGGSASTASYDNWLRYLLGLPSVCGNHLLWTKLLAQGTVVALEAPTYAENWASFLLGFNPVDISSEPLEVRQPGKNDPVPIASPREQYMMQLTKALFAAGNYAECIEQCRRALELVKKFHHGNQLWLSRRMALSLGNLGNNSEAIVSLKSLLGRKDEWFIRSEIGNLYLANGNHNQALAWFASAALQRGHSEYKVGLYQSAGELCLLIPVHAAMAIQHFRLAVSIRREKNWKVPNDLVKHIGQVEGGPLSSAMIYNELILFWEKVSLQVDYQNKNNENVSEGKVTRVLNEGGNGDGFITDKDGRSIYFRMKRVKGSGVIGQGERVICSFYEREFGGRKVLNARWVKKVE